MRPSEIRSLTGVRGIAALLVVFYHYFQDSAGLGALHTVIAHGYIAVDLFFVLSGFVMALTYGRSFRDGFDAAVYGGFLLKRLGRVYPLYILVTLIVAALVAAGLIAGDIASPLALASNVLMVQAWGLAPSIGGPTWSISTEFAAYVLFPMLVWLVLAGPAVRAWGAAGTAIAVIGWLSVLDAATLHQVYDGVASRSGPLDIFGSGTPFPLLRCFGGFVLGLSAFRIWAARPSMARGWWGDGAALMVVALLFFRDADVALDIGFAALVVALAAGGSRAARFCASAPMFWLGEISYSIYLVHRPVENLTRHALVAALNAHHLPHAYTVAGVVPLVLTLAVSAVTFYGVERPARALSRRLIGASPRPIEAEPAAP